MLTAHAAAADEPLSCFAVTPTTSSTDESFAFTVRNDCSKRVTGIGWEMTVLRNDGEKVYRRITEEFAMLPDDPQALGSNLAAFYPPGASRTAVLGFGTGDTPRSVRLPTLELKILAVGFADGSIIGTEEGVQQVRDLRISSLARSRAQIRLYRALLDSATRTSACSDWQPRQRDRDVPAALAHLDVHYLEWDSAALNICPPPSERPAGWNAERWIQGQIESSQRHEAVYERLVEAQ